MPLLDGLGDPDLGDPDFLGLSLLAYSIGIYASDLKLFVAKGRCGYIWEGRIFSFR